MHKAKYRYIAKRLNIEYALCHVTIVHVCPFVPAKTILKVCKPVWVVYNYMHQAKYRYIAKRLNIEYALGIGSVLSLASASQTTWLKS